MHKYTAVSITSFVLFVFFVLQFDYIVSIVGEMIPFVGVLLFGFVGVIFFILRGTVWYKKDLAERTLDQWKELEEEEGSV